MYQNLPIHSPIKGHLDCFSIFAIVSNKYLNEHGKVLISLGDSDFFDKYSEMGLLYHTVVPFLIF